MLYTAHGPGWWLLWLILGIGVAYWMYRRTEPELPRWKRFGMASLRAAAISLLGMLLLEPVWSFRRLSSLRPRILWLVDDSRSLNTSTPSGVPAETVRNLVRMLQEADWRTLEPVWLRFAEDTAPLAHPDSLRFSGRRTNIWRALEAASSRYRERTRALVLITDGNHNTGPNPLYGLERLALPVYVLAVGDSTPRRDVRIERVLAGLIAYVGSEVPVSVSVAASGFDQPVPVVARLEREGRELAREALFVEPGRSALVEFRLVPDRPGRQLYRVRLDPQPGEYTYANNEASFAIDVLDRRRRVLVVAGAPDPDVALLRHVLALDPELEVEGRTQKNAAEFYEGPLPDRLDEFQALFLVGFPGRVPMESALQRLRRAVLEEGVPVIFVLSRQTDLTRLQEAFGAVWPVNLQPRSLQQELAVFFEPTGAGRAHPVLEPPEGRSEADWDKLPPVFTFEGVFEPRPAARVLATMRVRDVRLPEPLLVVQQLGRTRSAALLGWGWWRWKTLGEATAGVGALYDGLMRNLLRWASAVRDERRVRVRPAQLVYDPQEAIDFLGQVYDESLQPLSDAEVWVQLRGPGGGERRFALQPRGEGRYEARIDPLPPGLYRYQAEARRAGERIGTDSGELLVEPLDLEAQQTQLNLPLLRQLAARSGGELFGPNAVEALQDRLRSRHGTVELREQTVRIAFWQHPAVLAILLLLLASEWIWRRRNSLP